MGATFFFFVTPIIYLFLESGVLYGPFFNLFLSAQYFQQKCRGKSNRFCFIFLFICNLLRPLGVRDLFFEKKGPGQAPIVFIFAHDCQKKIISVAPIVRPRVFFFYTRP